METTPIAKKLLELFENPIEEYTGGESFYGLDR